MDFHVLKNTLSTLNTRWQSHFTFNISTLVRHMTYTKPAGEYETQSENPGAFSVLE